MTSREHLIFSFPTISFFTSLKASQPTFLCFPVFSFFFFVLSAATFTWENCKQVMLCQQPCWAQLHGVEIQSLVEGTSFPGVSPYPHFFLFPSSWQSLDLYLPLLPSLPSIHLPFIFPTIFGNIYYRDQKKLAPFHSSVLSHKIW